ncbi:MAG: ATP-binding cassette domain-containing protein, partial [Oscillospiraceae bacterium]|nr:ATP-binding cassette domain-containing protein [Oscillospiraceae bacterium]
FRGIPDELFESASIDGATYLQKVICILAPLGKTAVVLNAIFNFIWTWNDLFMPTVMLQKNDVKTVMVALSGLMSRYSKNPTLQLSGLLLCVVPVVAVITWVFQSRLIVVGRRIREANSRIVGAYNEGITGAKTSKTLVIEDKNCRQFRELTSDMYRQMVRRSVLSGIMIPLVLLCGSASVADVLYAGGRAVMSGSIDYGTLAAFITYAVAIIDPVAEVARVINELITAQVCLERVTAIIDEKPLIEDRADVLAKYGTAFEPKRENWESIRGDITFDHVWFRYPDGGDWVLEDFCLHVPAGTNVAIVGETGAGKSTLVNLVCRFFEPTRGRILIDGVDYRERSQLWLHSNLGYVLQDAHLFSGTVADNIRYGRLDATDEEIRRAAEMVHADQVARSMPEGYDAQVGEGGDRLSTGEKQLISFARAIVADPPIFVLDEATSSIDTQTELMIQNAISKVLEGRTSFVIAHRLSTIRMADIILVVDDGKIVERGTHEELMAQGGAYKALYDAMEINVP